MLERFKRWVLTPTGMATFVIAIAAALSIPLLGRDLWRLVFGEPVHEAAKYSPPSPKPLSLNDVPTRQVTPAPPPWMPPYATWPAPEFLWPPPTTVYSQTKEKPAPRKSAHRRSRSRPIDYGWYLERVPLQGDSPDVNWVDQWRKCRPSQMTMPCYYPGWKRRSLPQYKY